MAATRGPRCQPSPGHGATTTQSRTWLVLGLVVVVLVACCAPDAAEASALSDVNKMLRDSSNNNKNNINNNNNINTNNDKVSADFLASTETATTSVRNSLESDSSVELLRFVDGQEADSQAQTSEDADAESLPLPLHDQVRLLTKQLNALMLRRREDYEMLERNLRKSLRITTSAAAVDADVRSELEELRHELKTLRDGHLIANKEKLTVDWLTQSIAEIRKQLEELQQLATSAAQDVGRRSQSYEDLATIRSDYRQLKLELAAMRERQERVEVFVQELREETFQQEEDFKRLLHQQQQEHHQHLNHKEQSQQQSQRSQVNSGENESQENKVEGEDETQTEAKDIELADHRRRHNRLQHQQIHELQLAQRDLRRQVSELKYHRIGERVRSLELEQHRIADANFNLSRQIASLDKLHTSMLELLEDVEGLQNKMDKGLPDLRHEISKLEFGSAQLNAEQSLVREEGKNVARSVQAMAVSVSALQEEREGVREMRTQMQQLQQTVDRLQNMMGEVQRSLVHHKRRAGEKLEAGQHHGHHGHHGGNNNNNGNNNGDNNNNNNNDNNINQDEQNAAHLVAKLEHVEQQYESIIDKLPRDCGDVELTSGAGLYLIAPGIDADPMTTSSQQQQQQHRPPLMAHCSADGWTTVQRRYDGSADFNRSWEDYAAGFGSPAGEYWIGNEQLHALTAGDCTALRIQMQDIYDNTWVAEYSSFRVSSRSDGFRLHIGGYRGNASDALDYQQDMQFSAIDVDRDISQTHCAANYEGGWWFSHCQHANLNGRYNLGLTWFDAARNEWIAVKSSLMQVRRLSAASCAAVTNTKANERPSVSQSESESERAGAVAGEAATVQAARAAGASTTLTSTTMAMATATATPSYASAPPAATFDHAYGGLAGAGTTTTIASVV